MKTPVTAATTAVNSGAATPAEGVPRHHHHHHHTGRRLRQFLHPDGKKIHVAGSPEEAERLKKTLSETEEKCPFELVLHGSDEHVGVPFHFTSKWGDDNEDSDGC